MSVTPMQKRRYDAASQTSRTSSWITPGTDASSALSRPDIIRNRARDLVRNNPWAQKAVAAIVNNVVGYGIRAQFSASSKRASKQVQDVWQRWAESTAIDADGLHNLYGIQQLAMRCLIESGECLVRLRMRRPEDNLPIPAQVQVLEPDYLYTGNDGSKPNGGYVHNGIEYDSIGRRTGYYIYKFHPGSSNRWAGLSSAVSYVPATDMIHLYRVDRPGQDRGVSWFAPVMIRLRELDIYEDAFLKRQQLANLFAGFVTCDDPTVAAEEIENELPDLTPGTMYALQPGRHISFNAPPGADSYGQTYLQSNLRAIAAGMGVSYEALTGDLSQVNFSSARMGAHEFGRNIDAWRWNLVIPHLCQRIADWFLTQSGFSANVEWTPPARVLVDPAKEIPAIRDAVRNGLMTWAEAIREQGYDPSKQIDEIAAFNQLLDQSGIVLDCDPRKTSGQGQSQQDMSNATTQTDSNPA